MSQYDCKRCKDTKLTHDGIGPACNLITVKCSSCSYSGCYLCRDLEQMCEKCANLKCTRCKDTKVLFGQIPRPCPDCKD
jgi:hypothetical protein